jgi:predicted CXXCH cytochrome family protein
MRSWIWLVCCLFVIGIGCSRQTLSIFLDGVPAGDSKKNAPQQKQNAAANHAVLFEHAPYAARQCDACHDRARTNNLVAPKEELCYMCHDFQSNKKYVHGPVASGGCLVCHDPHSSKYPKLLVAEATSFCFYCHDPAALPKDESHARTGLQCTACHDAHMSDKIFLLK